MHGICSLSVDSSLSSFHAVAKNPSYGVCLELDPLVNLPLSALESERLMVTDRL